MLTSLSANISTTVPLYKLDRRREIWQLISNLFEYPPENLLLYASPQVNRPLFVFKFQR